MKRIAALVLVLLVAIVGLMVWQARDPSSGTTGGGFDLFAFFEGTSVSEGDIRKLLVFDRVFTARFSGAMDDGRFRLDERFAFPEGERLQVWTLTRGADGALSGTVETERADGALAPPVPVAGTSDGAGVVLTYEGFAPGGGERLLRFRHHMALQPDGAVRNHVVVAKWGLPLATSDVTFAKDAAALSSQGVDR